jgi:hypothetical protein
LRPGQNGGNIGTVRREGGGMATAVVDFSKEARPAVVVIGEAEGGPAFAAPAAAPAASDVPTTAKASTSFGVDLVWAVASVIVVLLAAVIADRVAKDSAFPGTTPVLTDGLTIFAVFYVAAQAIERLLEPFSGVLLPKDEAKADAAEATSNAKKKVQDAATDSGANSAATEALATAAQKQAKLGALEAHRTILFWVLATVLATAVSAGMKLYFLQRVGIANSSRWWEVLATGLIIGAGTKPLHDVIEFISAKKEAADTTKAAN